MPNIEIKRTTRLSRQEAAERLIALGQALSSGSELDLGTNGYSVKLGVAGQVNWEFEIEIDGDETELEIEISWKDDPKDSALAAPAADETGDADPVVPPAAPRRGRPRKADAG